MAASLALLVCVCVCPARAAEAPAPEPAAAESLAAFPAPHVRAWQVGLTRPDRLEHAGLSFALTTALLIATREPVAAAGATLALGVAKELWDARGESGSDGIDLAADASGITLALVCVRARGH